MPELPEVKTVVKHLNEIVKNKIIDQVEIKKTKLIKEISIEEFNEKLKNKAILNITNYGKFIVFHLSENLILLSHLRMEGKYHTNDLHNNKHDYVIFYFKDGTKLIYNDSRQFGTFHLRNTNDFLNKLPLSKLAKEPKDIDVNDLFKKIKNKTQAIKITLLDQKLISGIGNIYADEILWELKINPLTSTKNISLEQLKSILITSNNILEKATSLGGSSIRTYDSLDGQKGSYQNFLNVHTKEKQKCPRCGHLIKKIKVNGRGTYFCYYEQN